MNHDEIWDDSALIESWNDALAEYKKYHSIHAKGGSVDDLPPDQPEVRPDAKPETRGSSQPMDESEGEERRETAMGDAQMDDARQGGKSLDESFGPAGMPGPAVSGMSGPQTLLGSGLYEGQQQQAKQQSQARQQSQGQGNASA